MATQLSQLRTIFYAILREDEDSSAYPVVLADLFMNAAQQKICNGRVVNPLTKEEVRKWQLPFLFTDYFLSNVQSTTLSVNAAIWDTTLTVASTANFPASGTIIIAGNIIQYTGTTSTTFTGCTGVAFAFQWGIEVSIAYPLPEDYQTPINVVYNNNYKLPQQLNDDIYENLNDYKGQTYGRSSMTLSPFWPYKVNPFYSIKDNEYLLIFNRNNNGDIIRFRYEKQATEMTSASSVCEIPNDIYAKTTIPYLAVAEMLYNRGEESRAAEIINFAIGQIREMYTSYDDSMYEEISGVQYGLGKSKLNI